MSAQNTPKPITASRFGYPFKNKQGQEITDPQLFYDGLAVVQGGHYLLSPHGFFHGGVHIAWSSGNAFELNEGIRCLADGDVVAYRINRRYYDATPGTAGDGPALRPYSTGFVLVRHRLQAPTPPPPPKPVKMDNPGADIRNWGAWLYDDPQGHRRRAWLRHGTPVKVEIGKIAPGQGRYVRVLDTSGFGLPREGWIERTWLAIDPLAGTGMRSMLGFKDVIATHVYRGDSVDPEASDVYARNKAEQERPATPAAPTLTLYSLYMHLADFESYGRNPNWVRPGYWPSTRYRVGEKAKDRKRLARERSGRQWVQRYPGSNRVGDLTPSFAGSVGRFIHALRAAGANVAINATYRPPERAYLMHYSWRIAREGFAPTSVPEMAGVNIDWAHLDTGGKSDHQAALQAAREMVAGFAIVHRPSLTSRHTERRAIDMTISRAIGADVQGADGLDRRVNSCSDLHSVGQSYGVIKLLSDPPHWSDDGH